MIWPFHFDPTVGYIAGGSVFVLGTLARIVNLISRALRGPRRRQAEA